MEKLKDQLLGLMIGSVMEYRGIHIAKEYNGKFTVYGETHESLHSAKEKIDAMYKAMRGGRHV